MGKRTPHTSGAASRRDRSSPHGGEQRWASGLPHRRRRFAARPELPTWWGARNRQAVRGPVRDRRVRRLEDCRLPAVGPWDSTLRTLTTTCCVPAAVIPLNMGGVKHQQSNRRDERRGQTSVVSSPYSSPLLSSSVSAG